MGRSPEAEGALLIQGKERKGLWVTDQEGEIIRHEDGEVHRRPSSHVDSSPAAL